MDIFEKRQVEQPVVDEVVFTKKRFVQSTLTLKEFLHKKRYKSEKKVQPDQTLTPRQIMERFLKTGNMGKVEAGTPQYQDQETLTIDSPDYLKMRNLDRLEQIDKSRELKAALDKARLKAEKAREESQEAVRAAKQAQAIQKGVEEALKAMPEKQKA